VIILGKKNANEYVTMKFKTHRNANLPRKKDKLQPISPQVFKEIRLTKDHTKLLSGLWLAKRKT